MEKTLTILSFILYITKDAIFGENKIDINPASFLEKEIQINSNSTNTTGFGFNTDSYTFLLLIRKSEDNKEKIEQISTFYETSIESNSEMLLKNLNYLVVSENEQSKKTELISDVSVTLLRIEQHIQIAFEFSGEVNALKPPEAEKLLHLLNKAEIRIFQKEILELFEILMDNDEWHYLLLFVSKVKIFVKSIENHSLVKSENTEINILTSKKNRVRKSKINNNFKNGSITTKDLFENNIELSSSIYLDFSFNLPAEKIELNLKQNLENKKIKNSDLNLLQKNLLNEEFPLQNKETVEFKNIYMQKQFEFNNKKYELELTYFSITVKTSKSTDNKDFLSILVLARLNYRLLFLVLKSEKLNGTINSKIFEIEKNNLKIKIDFEIKTDEDKLLIMEVTDFSILESKATEPEYETSEIIQNISQYYFFRFLAYQVYANHDYDIENVIYDPTKGDDNICYPENNNSKSDDMSEQSIDNLDETKMSTESSKETENQKVLKTSEGSNKEKVKKYVLISGLIVGILVVLGLIIYWKFFYGADTNNHSEIALDPIE